VPPAQGAGTTGTAPPPPAMAALMPLPATSSSFIQPPTPIMGGLLQSTYGEFEPWTGGRPLYDWSGLNTMWVTKSKSPNQLHPTSSSGAQKSYNLSRTPWRSCQITNCFASMALWQTVVEALLENQRRQHYKQRDSVIHLHLSQTAHVTSFNLLGLFQWNISSRKVALAFGAYPKCSSSLTNFSLY
jgi:hypothetical protein